MAENTMQLGYHVSVWTLKCTIFHFWLGFCETGDFRETGKISISSLALTLKVKKVSW